MLKFSHSRLMSYSFIYLKYSRSLSVFLMVLTNIPLYLGYLCINLTGSFAYEHLKGLLVLRLCLISVTTLGDSPSWNSLIHFFLQRCPSRNLWSNASSFPESLLFPTTKLCTYCSHYLEFYLFTKRKSNPFFKANAKALSITLAQIALSKFSQPLFIPHWSLSTF